MSYVKHVHYNEIQLFSSCKPLLGHLDIELTERCNNACIHCYINQFENNPDLKSREMDTTFIKGILQQAADLGCLTVRFTGGEPLLREDFIELYTFSRHLGIQVILFTNATLITEDLCVLFKHIPPGKPISVSVYGMHAASYDAVVRRTGAFEEFWHGITLLREHEIPFTVKQSLLPQNKDEMDEFETFASQLPNMEHSPSYSMNFDLRARRDNPAKNRAIKRLRLSPGETIAMLARQPDKYINEMQQFVSKFMMPQGDRLFPCGAGLGTCVDAYGNAQMCTLLRHPATVYSLDEQLHQQRHPDTSLSPLEYALKIVFPEVRQMRAQNPAYLKRCALCFLRGLCEQCPAKSWEEHGTLDTPVEYLCEVAHAQARYLGLVKESEIAWLLPESTWRERIKLFTLSFEA